MKGQSPKTAPTSEASKRGAHATWTSIWLVYKFEAPTTPSSGSVID